MRGLLIRASARKALAQSSLRSCGMAGTGSHMTRRTPEVFDARSTALLVEFLCRVMDRIAGGRVLFFLPFAIERRKHGTGVR